MEQHFLGGYHEQTHFEVRKEFLIILQSICFIQNKGVSTSSTFDSFISLQGEKKSKWFTEFTIEPHYLTISF